MAESLSYLGKHDLIIAIEEDRYHQNLQNLKL